MVNKYIDKYLSNIFSDKYISTQGCIRTVPPKEFSTQRQQPMKVAPIRSVRSIFVMSFLRDLGAFMQPSLIIILVSVECSRHIQITDYRLQILLSIQRGASEEWSLWKYEIYEILEEAVVIISGSSNVVYVSKIVKNSS